MTPLSPLTATGTLLFVVVPSPSCPRLLLPHATTVPSARRARLCSPPPAIAVALLRSLSATGSVAQGTRAWEAGGGCLQSFGPSWVPLPSWTFSLKPQARTPVAAEAEADKPPIATRTATRTPVVLVQLIVLPSFPRQA